MSAPAPLLGKKQTSGGRLAASDFMSTHPSPRLSYPPSAPQSSFLRDVDLAELPHLFLPSAFPEAGMRLDFAGSDKFGKQPTDHTRCDDGVMPLICPTCQMVSQDASGIAPAVGYFAWGCFRYFCCPVMEASDRTQSHHALAVEHPPQLSTFSAAMNASCGMSTLPNCRIFFLPSFCFSRSLRLRVMSPP